MKWMLFNRIYFCEAKHCIICNLELLGNGANEVKFGMFGFYRLCPYKYERLQKIGLILDKRNYGEVEMLLGLIESEIIHVVNFNNRVILFYESKR